MLKIVGLLRKTISFKDESGRTVSGYQVFCTDDSRDKVDGLATLDFFMSDSVCKRSSYVPVLGDDLDYIAYNRFGRLDRVIPHVS